MPSARLRDPRALIDRRGWLRVGGLGLGGLSLAHLLRTESATAGKPAPAARSCVLFVLQGGPSQLELWDMKPDAPAEVRGEFKPAATRVPGVQITEHLPRLARVSNLFTIVRSMTHKFVFHNAATFQALSGRTPSRDATALNVAENDHPHPGAVLALKRPAPPHIPTAVSFPVAIEEGFHPVPGQTGGFLGARFAPFAIAHDPNEPGFTVDGLADLGAGGTGRLAGRQNLLGKLDRTDRLDPTAAVADAAGCRQRAFDLLAASATRHAFDLERESSRVREWYGRHTAGQSLLLARRLVEAGVRLVTVYWGGRLNKPLPYWDTHDQQFPRLKDELLPPFDQCFSAFLEDLHGRGLLDSTLVVCMGEFGRTPRLGQFTGNGGDPTGRDHWPHCYSLVVAGGGAQGGRVLGRSDARAAYPLDDPYTPQDVTATLLQQLGVDPRDEVQDGFGRPVPLSAGTVRPQLFGG